MSKEIGGRCRALRVAVDAQDAGAVVSEKFTAEGTVLLPGGLLVIAGFEIQPGGDTYPGARPANSITRIPERGASMVLFLC